LLQKTGPNWYINEYDAGTASSRDDALAQCQAIDPNNHLWIINHQLEMDQVMEWFSK
jgi:hypothetical protein